MFKTVGALIRALAPKRKPLEPEVRFCRPPFSVPPAPRSVDDVLRAARTMTTTQPIAVPRVYSPSSVPRYAPGPEGIADAIDDAVVRRHTDEDRHQRDVVSHAPFAYAIHDSGASDSGSSCSGSCGGCSGGD